MNSRGVESERDSLRLRSAQIGKDHPPDVARIKNSYRDQNHERTMTTLERLDIIGHPWSRHEVWSGTVRRWRQVQYH